MNTASNTVPSNSARVRAGLVARSAQVLVVLLLEALVLFGGAGRTGWTWAWVYLGIYMLTIAINAPLLTTRHRDTMVERGRARFAHTWDMVVSLLAGLAQYVLLPLVAALDMRFGWSGEAALAGHLAGAALFALGLGLFSWAMQTNAYFSTTVRIQSERGHTVCTDGPYRLVRHPGYLGMLLQAAGAVLLLGSWWALIPAALAAASMVARTALEDRTLQRDLQGYIEYTGRVRYRLLPGIW